ncbi:MAG: BamA/TamA family outer membrane protein [Pontixanthobacter sp.]
MAQDVPQRLEDLIPDSAVDNPEEWARDGAGPADASFPTDPILADTLDADIRDADFAADPDFAAADGSQDNAESSVEIGRDDGEAEFADNDAMAIETIPMAEMPEIAIDWPDDLTIPRIEPDRLESFAETDVIEFAEPEIPFTQTDRNARIVEVNDELVLAFPSDQRAFPEGTAFVSRFEALSTIEELEGDDENIAQLSARARADEQLLNELLRVYGYYDAQILRSVVAEPAGAAGETPDTDSGAQVRFDILPGQRYRIGAIDLGDLARAPDYGELRTTFEIATGDPVSSDAITAERYDLDRALGESGYPFAVIGESDLLIDHRAATGDLTLPVTPGGKYVFGEVTSSIPGFLPGDHLASIARFEPGDIFQRSRQLDLRRAITATGLISSLSIARREVVAPQGDEPGVVALDVQMTRAPVRTVSGAIGYGSEEGFRLQASWEHRNLFPPEGALKFRGIVGTQEQLAGVTFRKSNFGGRDRVLNLDAYATTIDSDAFDAQSVAFVASYEQASTLLFQKPLSWSFGFEAIATDERPPEVNGIRRPRQAYFVGALPVGALIDTSDDLLDPTRGFRLGGRLSPEISQSQGTTSFYLRSQIDASYYRRVTDRVVMAGRTRLGSIPGTQIFNIAPSRRYYAGGGSSVRGYGFQQIGPRDIADQPNGGRSVVEFSLEARIATGFFDGALSVVPFVDAGSVSTSPTPDLDEIKLGAGIGVRYVTGFGPIRVDVGVPINPGPNDNPVGVYVSLGQAF